MIMQSYNRTYSSKKIMITEEASIDPIDAAREKNEVSFSVDNPTEKPMKYSETRTGTLTESGELSIAFAITNQPPLISITYYDRKVSPEDHPDEYRAAMHRLMTIQHRVMNALGGTAQPDESHWNGRADEYPSDVSVLISTKTPDSFVRESRVGLRTYTHNYLGPDYSNAVIVESNKLSTVDFLEKVIEPLIENKLLPEECTGWLNLVEKRS
jgi:hypothetical protein